MILCTRCSKNAEPLASPPVGGQLGNTIQQSICPECWEAWLNQQAVFINHYGLLMADPDDRKKLREAMKEFLGFSSQ